MELHLLFGVANHLYKSLCQQWKNSLQGPKMMNFQPQPFHGGQFAGNECRKFFRNVGLLQQLAEKHACFLAFPFIDRLRKFDAVVHASIRNVTQDNYCIFIEEFKSSYLKLQNTSVTLIAYAVLFHVPKFATAIYWASIKNKQQNHSIITSTITGNGSKGILIIQTTLRIF